MKNIIGLIEAIVKPLTNDSEKVSVTVDETDELDTFNLHVSSDDAGRIIGKQGRVAQAIRTVVYSQNHDSNKRLKLNIVPE